MSIQATAAQCKYLVDLFSTYNPLVAQSLDAKGPVNGQRDQEFTNIVESIRNSTHVAADFNCYTKQQASELISSLVRSIRTLRQEVSV